MRENSLLSFVLLSLLLVCGCGDGSGSDRRNDVAEIPSEIVNPSIPGEIIDPPADLGSDKTGFLIGSPVSGVSYQTPTYQGVTGLDGSFQYKVGEIVRFMLGDTLLGKVTGQAQVTPFDLAGSAVVTGINITWELERGEEDPFRADFIGDGLQSLESRGDLFYTVLNISVLLQSLDFDADPVNGIEIVPDVAALFDGVNLDLSQDWEAFRNEPALRHALWRANTQNLFNEAHGVVNPAPALKHLYVSLGINARTVAISLERWDWVPYRLESTQYEYDASGNLTREERDDRGDGTPDNIVSYEYDADGNVTREEDWFNSGGHPTNEVRWQYDASGNPPRIEWDWDGDGVRDYIENWQYDAQGNESQFVEWDENDDGGLNSRFIRQLYYADGNLTRTEWSEDVNEPPWRIDSYEYDVNGHLTHRDAPTNGMESWEYDADGNLTRHKEGYDEDGNPSFIKSYRYDVNGNLTRHEADYSDDDNPRLFIESYEYDAHDNLTRVELHAGNEVDGTPIDVKTWQYDTNGNQTRYEHHEVENSLPKFSECRRYQYNASGKLVQMEEDGNGDGRLDAAVSYEYDINGNLTRVAEDFGVDGNLNSVESWQYDTDGNLMRYEKDDDNDGMPELARQYKATGWGHFFQISRPEDPRALL